MSLTASGSPRAADSDTCLDGPSAGIFVCKIPRPPIVINVEVGTMWTRVVPIP
jgi:hypothetical protein